MKIGFLVNPVAGMGGSVGLKGTDGKMLKKASELGASPVSFLTGRTFLNELSPVMDVFWVTAPGVMGENLLREFGRNFIVVGKIGTKTTAQDTIRIVGRMVAEGIELLVFVGGDGTARDIYSSIGIKLPVIAVPAGVKVFSSVFAYSAEAAANLLKSYLEGASTSLREVLDVDEDAYRQGKLNSSLFGYLLTPEIPEYVQPGKITYGSQPSNQDSVTDICSWVVDRMDPEIVYLLGPGSTIKGITDQFSLPKTLLGVDAFYQNRIIRADINERMILSLLDTYSEINIIVTPIGGNGFIFGRGNKQFTPEVIKRIGINNIMVIATPDKVNSLDCLRVDTGDAELDHSLCGFMNVITGYQESRMMKVCH